MIETVSIASYHDYKTQGGLKVLKAIAPEVARLNEGARILIVDDLVDTGATAKVVREMLPRAHFAAVYAKPLGRPMVDTFITEVSQDTWIYFPWDMGLAFQPPIAGDPAEPSLRRGSISQRNVKQARLSGRGETGRRKGLKIPRPQGCAGSTPAVRTNPRETRSRP